MYSLGRGPSKLATRTKLRGPVQQIDKLERFETSVREAEVNQLAEMSSPRPVFNGKRNYHRSNSHNNNNNQTNNNSSPLAHEPQLTGHEENVRFVSMAWERIQREYKQSLDNGTDGPVFYQEKQPSSKINGFEPLNIDQWHQQRVLEKVES